ncbi:hypothetical protein [Streptomyces sp. KAU_LT]|uniref:hypothetical protein n=1 Tax=Streptomyces sp. KAU_LT TaxID=3046669 RepID=UPI0024B77BA0|nr:hypothetical protein [Streptomyces sp. KAU_LT]MDI9830302.1 hypothetical protein [Streptomyces sp. KAU_LT]
MSVEQLPAEVREFANCLDGLLARLDQGGGWCGVFWERDPEGMRACLDGREVPPWDVVESLLGDLAARYGTDGAAPYAERARALHAAAVAAHDARPGGRDALGDRLDVMLREQRYAAERRTALEHALASATTRAEADALRLDLAWARDDHARASARCEELRRRMATLDHRDLPPRGHIPGAEPDGAALQPEEPTGQRSPGPAPTVPDPAPTVPRQRRRRRGGARFAGAVEEDTGPVAVPPAVEEPLPAPAAGGRGSPRGARFAGVAEETPEARPGTAAEELGAADREDVLATVEALRRLRGAGRTGEAHALLVEIAYWPAVRFPLLAAEMRHAGLAADWATLLWEAASLPADRLVAAADALTAAGHAEDGERILREGVVRPAPETGRAVLGLAAEGRHREVRVLLDAYVRVRTPEEAARSAAADPGTLVPLLLDAARGVSDERYWDLVHALRVAGFTA